MKFTRPRTRLFTQLQDAFPSYAGRGGHHVMVKEDLSGLDSEVPAGGAADEGEGHVTLLGPSYSAIGQGVWTIMTSGSQWAGFIHNGNGDADGDNISFEAYLAEGTYTLGLLALIGDSLAIVDIDIEGSEVASFDLYYATPQYNQRFTQADIAIASSGLKTITLRVDGRNASSTGWACYFTYIAFWRQT